MRISILVVVLALFSAVFFGGCSSRTLIDSHTIIPTFNITPADITIGEKVSHTMDYIAVNDMQDRLYDAAVIKSGYDMIILPVFTIKADTYSTKVTITGYGANLKKR